MRFYPQPCLGKRRHTLDDYASSDTGIYLIVRTWHHHAVSRPPRHACRLRLGAQDVVVGRHGELVIAGNQGFGHDNILFQERLPPLFTGRAVWREWLNGLYEGNWCGSTGCRRRLKTIGKGENEVTKFWGGMSTT
jgi:hypothetical protein